MEPGAWAEKEFGTLKAGDARLRSRLVKVAAAAAARPHGYVSVAAPLPAEKTAAYRLLRNPEVKVEEVSAAARRACIDRCQGQPFVYVAEDGSSLALPDPHGGRGTGVVGTHQAGARGFIVMNAVVVLPDGTPAGVGGQVWWERKEKPLEVDHHKRPPEEKEIRHWVELAKTVTADFKAANAPKIWFQFDRGADAWYVLDEAVKNDWWVTVRASTNRRLATPTDAGQKYLRDAVASTSAGARFDIELPGGAGQAARRARMEVRFTEVELRLQDDRTGKTWPVKLWAVLATEASPPPGSKPLDWLLLTTRPVRDASDAIETVLGYSIRWRVEEFHRSWKSAGCNVELTHLGKKPRIQIWATILASVAVRILRLTYLSRNSPDLPANVEFTKPEIEAAYVANKRRWDGRRMPTISVVTHLIAQAGGHAPGLRGPPPGAEVLARGLVRHATFVEALAAFRGAG